MDSVVVLGSTGMLGNMVADYLTAQGHTIKRPRFGAHAPVPTWILHKARACVNCIGVIRPYCDNVEAAIRVNALFPHDLARLATLERCPVIQIATDCVFSGARGGYTEQDLHDGLDTYARTKSLGEVESPWVLHLRSSIVGPEWPGRTRNLLEWFLSHKDGETVPGYVNHLWNGCTTLQFARVVAWAIENWNAIEHRLYHVVLNETATKYELLSAFARAYKRDLNVVGTETGESLDMTLSTVHPHSVFSPETKTPVEDAVCELAAWEHTNGRERNG